MLRAATMDTARFDHLIFVCTNERDPSDPRGSCAARGSRGLLERLKALTHEHGLKGKVRSVSCGCLDRCGQGCNAVVFSRDPARRESWYTKLTPADADQLFTSHVLEGKRLERP